ncbi:MAG: glycerol-3-phosphate responsive antiterminator [Lactobacillus sp.]|jgi:glycerol uptake operon antiterminator|nr:glycerol-3-phosphate responsive antiterminator [Lactobacillus sp.]MCI2033293.1 glycerol-3-phosphate responsive antiterminator [Lactobacillus sp.]
MLSRQTIIPSSLNGKYLRKACRCESDIVLLSGVNIGNLAEFVSYIHQQQKQAFVHVDITGGFRPDEIGIGLLKNMYHLDGIISTNMHVIARAKALGLETVYRLFLFDSRSLERAAGVLHGGEFSALEILPSAYALSEVENIRQYVGSMPLIAGGFVRTREEIKQIFEAGFAGVTTSDCALWQ